MNILSQTRLVEIAEAGGGLPVAAQDEISSAFREYHEDEGAEFEVRSGPTKKNVERALSLATELSHVLASLEQNGNYKCFNTGNEPVDVALLTHARNAIDQLCTGRLVIDCSRFQRKSERNRERKRLTHFVRRLLEIRSRYTDVALPVEVQETVASGRFRRYLELCTGLQGPWLDRVLETVTREFARARKTARRRTVTA
jgi:hypothetical protein